MLILNGQRHFYPKIFILTWMGVANKTVVILLPLHPYNMGLYAG